MGVILLCGVHTAFRPATRGMDFAMNDEEKVDALSSDVFALKMLLPGLLSRIGQLDPLLASAIEGGFQDTIHQLEHLMAASPSTESNDRCIKALATIRRLHAAVLTELSKLRTNPTHDHDS